MVYSCYVVEVVQSATFAKWLSKLGDRRARARVQVRIDRLALGHPGDVKSLGDGVSELRIDYGPGYRLYFARRGPIIIVLLCGGTKSTQQSDIRRAIEIAKNWRD
jgi:putative addiction module killer protein